MRRLWRLGLGLGLLCSVGLLSFHFAVKPLHAVQAYVPSYPWPMRIVLPIAAISDWNYFEGDESSAVVHGWQVHGADASDVLRHLNQIPSMASRGWGNRIHIEHPEGYSLQFLGIEREGKRQIFLNAFCGCFGSEDDLWKTHLAVVADGGTCYWHVTYDPATGRFHDLEINGRA